MRPGHHAFLLLVLALAGCDKPEKHNPETITPPAKRTERPQRNATLSIEKKLRTALASASEIESAPERDKAIAAVAWDALEPDSELSRQAFERLTPDSPERIRLIQHLVMRMAEENVDDAMRWAATFDSEDEKSAAFGHVALVLADSDPHRAANLLSEAGIEGRAFDVVAVQVVRRWAAQSPADAAAWVELFPPGESRSAGIQVLVSQWITTDEQAVTTWMTTVSDPSIRDEIDRAVDAAQKKSRPPNE